VTGVARWPRTMVVGWLFHLRYLMRDSFVLAGSLIFPLLTASTTLFMFKAGHGRETMLYAALGAGMLSMWESTLFGSGAAVQEQRWIGTLELLVAAPSPLALSIAPFALATATMGLISFTGTYVWAWLLFGMSPGLAHPLSFVVAVVVTIVSLGMLGTILASTFVRLRNANALTNMLTYPMTLGAGLLVPLALLPAWVTPVSWLLSPTWGIQAIRAAAFGGDAWPATGMCAALGVVYALLGAYLVAYMERLAREQAVLALA
jgi:ABC-2 type transport system permease protein